MALREYSMQRELWGPSPDLALSQGHLARAIDDIVEKLGLDRCNRKYRHTPGEPAYDARALVKILIYGYARGITSTREMARQCEENIAFQYLSRGQCPDFRTIALFRRKKRHLFRWVFKKTVAMAKEMGIARLGLVALDSVKLAANASREKKMTGAQLEEEIKKLEEYVLKVEDCDRKEDEQYGSSQRGDELPANLQDAQQRKEKLEKAAAILKERQSKAKREAPKDVSTVDPEAPWVKKSGRVIRGYSGQVAADAEHQVIVAVKATAEPVDNEQLNPMVEEIEKTTGQAAEQVVADNGYYTDDAVLQASKSKTDCLVPDGQTAAGLNNPKRAQESSAYDVSRFTYDEAKDEFTCPQGKSLPFVGNHDRRGPTKIYRCSECADCPVRDQCTKSAKGRSIELRPDHAEIRKIRDRMQTETAKAIYKKRKAIIEPIFGRWQHNWGVRRLRLIGLAGFSVELHLLAIAHNLTKLTCCRMSLSGAPANT
jgi:transposase